MYLRIRYSLSSRKKIYIKNLPPLFLFLLRVFFYIINRKYIKNYRVYICVYLKLLYFPLLFNRKIQFSCSNKYLDSVCWEKEVGNWIDVPRRNTRKTIFLTQFNFDAIFFFFQLGLSFLGPSSSSHSLYQRPAENLGLGSCPFDSKTNWTHISHVSVMYQSGRDH